MREVMSVVSYCHTLVWLLLLLCDISSAYYCDHNTCSAEQFCCGDNQCCDSANIVFNCFFYVISAVFLVLLLYGIVKIIQLIVQSVAMLRLKRPNILDPYAQPWKPLDDQQI